MSAAGRPVLPDWLRARALAQPGYHAGDYLKLHADLAGEEPDGHYLAYGLWEGRLASTPERFAARLSQARAATAFDEAGEDLARAYRLAAQVRPGLHLPPDPTPDVAAMAEVVRAALARLGVALEERDGPPAPGAAGAIVLEPSAVFGPASAVPGDIARYRACLFVTARAPHAPDFPAELPFLLSAGAVAAFEPDAAALIAAAGAPAAWIGVRPSDLGPAPPAPAGLAAALGRGQAGFDAAGGWPARPIDVAALQTLSPARRQAWASLAEPLAAFVTVVRPSEGAAEAAARRHILARSRLALHLSEARIAAPPAAWLAEVAAARAVVASDLLPRHPLLRPGVTAFQAEPPELAGLIAHLLEDADGQAAAETAAEALRGALERRFDPELNGLALLRLLGAAEAAG